ncbi:hypothetical protein LINPERHAP1_LOCUS43 [Linum perenne]
MNSSPSTAPLTVHCDASFVDAEQVAAYDIGITNFEGRVCDGYSGTFHCASPIAAEAHAFMEATRYAANAPLRCTILSDCLTPVTSLKGPQSLWPWDCFGSLGRISNFLAEPPDISFGFTPRLLNCQADWVAKRTRSRTLPINWRSLVECIGHDQNHDVFSVSFEA